MLSTLTIAAQWLVERLSTEGGAEMHGLALNSAAVLGALQALLEEASRPGAPSGVAAPSRMTTAPLPPWRRDALEAAFARSIVLEQTWPAVALVVWQISATAGGVPVAPMAQPNGPGHGALGAMGGANGGSLGSSLGESGGATVEAGGLQLPLLACGAFCDIAPMMA